MYILLCNQQYFVISEVGTICAQFRNMQNIEDWLKLYSIGRFVNYGKNRAVLSYLLFRKVTDGSSPNLFL